MTANLDLQPRVQQGRTCSSRHLGRGNEETSHRGTRKAMTNESDRKLAAGSTALRTREGGFWRDGVVCCFGLMSLEYRIDDIGWYKFERLFLKLLSKIGKENR